MTRIPEKLKVFDAINSISAASSVGTLNEHSVHSFLKRYYETESDAHEIKIGRFVADIVGESGIIEIQTGSFDRLQKKLKAFTEYARVTVVYPIYTKRKVIFPSNGRNYTSPKHDTIYKIFGEIYKIKDFIKNPNVSFIIAELTVNEYRKTINKKKSQVTDRIVTGFEKEIIFETIDDFEIFLPKQNEFTAKEFSAHSGLYGIDGWGALKILTEIGLIDVDKTKKEFVYFKK
ncbi:MAG: hypothetical protein LBM87_01575 [Ruminococcus sp.]|nr:hypothetical protein [Ruminococcus sp.]